MAEVLIVIIAKKDIIDIGEFDWLTIV